MPTDSSPQIIDARNSTLLTLSLHVFAFSGPNNSGTSSSLESGGPVRCWWFPTTSESPAPSATWRCRT